MAGNRLGEPGHSPQWCYSLLLSTCLPNPAASLQIARPNSPRYIRFKSSGGHTVYTIDTSSSPDVYVDNTTNTLRFTVSGASLGGYRNYYILMDRGVVEGTLGCSGNGPPSPGISSLSAWTFSLGCNAGFSLNSARTTCLGS